ncbi:MAG: hypothetical protein RL535_13 [Pseudomonadota bacterium]|jgi:DNA-binding transcriptional LysR family regulator
MKDLNLLIVFEALWLERSVTAAGDRLGVSQAAVSASLKRLRAEYRDKLFTLVGRKMQPTPLAEGIAQSIIDALAMIRRTGSEPEPFIPSNSDKTFVIRTRDVGEVVCFPVLMKKLAKIAPDIKLKTVFFPLDETLSGLANGRIDLALGFLPSLETDIHKKVLFSQSYVCVVRKGHPIEGVDLTPKIMKQLQHLLVEYSGSGHAVLEKALTKFSGADSIKVRLPQYLSAPHFVVNSDLVWIVPKILAETLAKYYPLRIKELSMDLPDFEVALYWHERYHADNANKWMRDYIGKELKI